MEETFSNFPSNGILPKKETGALSFLSKYPNFDGKGVLIAILDTGVDPGAPGLKVTSDNKPKIVDLIDATGAGDVNISVVRKVENEHLLGLSGRKLKVPREWKNPSGDFHLGIKSVYDLCSTSLRDRYKKERKEKQWQPLNDDAIFQIQNKLNEFEAKKTEEQVKKNDDEKLKSNDLNDLLNSLTKEDLQTQLELLKDLENKIKDIGPVYDCIVWNDGDTWRACIDTTEKGDLENCKVLTNYKDSFEYGTFSYIDMLNYSVRILPDEKILQIVTDSSSHGTHVASIATGYYPDNPELNGVAPGAQIISIKIGDNRINGMETAFALVNACRHVAEYKCDLVNYSFGEPVCLTNLGPALVAVKELVEKFGVIFVTSAGNNGPGIETVGAPGGSIPTVISVAAYVSNDMLKAEHSLLGNGSSMLFSWSSRGPCIDGSWGVSVAAPGGAFAAVPNWSQRGTQLMSGTSMASPNCCGCLALILSGLKSNEIEFNPFGVKRAIENTAIQVDEPIGCGAGLIQVERAYDYLADYKDSIFQKIHFDIKYLGKPKNLKGIYLKNDDELTETRDYLIVIEPVFFENVTRSYLVNESIENDENLLNVQKDRISLSRKLVLSLENGESLKSFIDYPEHLYLVNSTRQFHIRIRANELEEGRHYFAQLKAFDLEDPKRACLFRIPITIVKPFVFDGKKSLNDYEIEFKNASFKQGQIYRHFIRAPLTATHAELTLNTDQNGSTRDHAPLFYTQTFTLENFRTPADQAVEEIYRLNNTNELKLKFKVQSNKIVQVTIAKNWSNIGHCTASYKIRLNGLYPRNGNELCAMSSQSFKIDVGSYLRNEDCDPSVSYKHLVQPLRPHEYHIEIVKPSMGVIKPIYQLILTYNFHQNKSGDVGCEIPVLSNYLYENEFQSIFWMIYESNSKRLVLSGDAFPVIYKYSKTLEKGDYVIRLFVRHEKIDLLEKLKETSLYLRHSISSISQDVYTSQLGVVKGTGKKSGSEKIQKNTENSFYLQPISDDKLPKGATNGHFLLGELSLFKDSAANKVDNFRIMYQINSHGKKAEKHAAKKVETSDSNVKVKSEEEKLKEAVRDVQVSYIQKVENLFETLRLEHENHIPIYINRIQYLEKKISNLAKNESEKKLALFNEIIELSKTALSKINLDSLLKFLGEKHHDSNDETKKVLESQKGWTIDLLVFQGLYLIEKQLIEKYGDLDDDDDNNFKAIELTEELRFVYRFIQKFIDISDEKASKFVLKLYLHLRLFAKSLKTLFKQLEDKPGTKSIDQTILNVLRELNLRHAVRYHENNLSIKYQSKYVNF
ncbi:unnamed protein product [Brachionus calyciflorus]|uniref:Tripeptidyl-peptidase 2 n=1 Tax=Brachionus calyciflorus TaxID=104777 RepID=A0A813M435_9BILA|nr:unnamed protein product [Brachionus calyciflorus]